VILLKRCLFDNDDEVRDRATLYLALLQEGSEPQATRLINNPLPVSVQAIESALEKHQESGPDQPFWLANVQELSSVQRAQQQAAKDPAATKDPSSSSAPAANVPATAALHGIPEFADLGACFKSSQRIPCTEQETEYMVECIKHVYQNHIVFQFSCTNTIEGTCLEDVTMEMDCDTEGFDEHSTVKCDSLPVGIPADTFTCMQRDEPIAFGTFTCSLRFIVKDVDEDGVPDAEGFEDEYQVDEVRLTAADYMVPAAVSDFRAVWTSLGEREAFECKEQFLMSLPTMKEATDYLIDKLSLAPCEGTHRVPEGASQHSLLLSGTAINDAAVLVRIMMQVNNGVQVRLMVRSLDPELTAGVPALAKA
jgi:coatomer protein complex subunit gamma